MTKPTLRQRMHQHDDNNEARWLWSGKNDRRRLIGGITWCSFAIGIEYSRDWDNAYICLMLGPLSLTYIWDTQHVWKPA